MWYSKASLKPGRPAAAQESGFHSVFLPKPTDQVHEGTQTNTTNKDCNCLYFVIPELDKNEPHKRESVLMNSDEAADDNRDKQQIVNLVNS